VTTRPRFDKSAMPSRHVTEGTFAAPQRAFYYAMGLEADDIHRPLVGVVSAWDGASPAAEAPLHVAEAVESGVTAGGATPRRFATMAAGGPSSLITRELVADTVELTMRGHSYDAVVGVAATPAAIAGLMLVACRLDVPAVVLPLTAPSLVTDVDTLAMAACATAVGLASAPAPTDATPSGMAAAGRRAGHRVTALLGDGRSARSLVTAASLRGGAIALARAGAPADLGLHLVALAAECGLDVDLADVVASMATVRSDVAWATGTLAPDGALVEGIASPVRAAAKVFDDEPAAAAWVAAHGWPAGTAIVVRFQGPRGGPGLPRLSALDTATAVAPGCLLVTDGRPPSVPGLTTVGLVGPEAAGGGPLARLRDGDTLELDGAARRIGVVEDLDARTPAAAPPRAPLPRSWMKYARLVGSARNGAVTHPGAGAEVIRYGDL
jgi:dihydroxyacid dehydratase/phosphogluconate dehydratase